MYCNLLPSVIDSPVVKYIYNLACKEVPYVFNISSLRNNQIELIDLLSNLNFMDEVYLTVCEIYIRISLHCLVHNSLKITEVKTVTHKVT